MDYERYESNLRERLIQLRMEAKLSQSELAEKLGVSRSTIRGWEIGETLPGAKPLMILADYYGVSVDYLFGREDMEKLYVGHLTTRLVLLIRELIREMSKSIPEKAQL